MPAYTSRLLYPSRPVVLSFEVTVVKLTRLKQRREQATVSQAELAQRTGLSRSTISLLERLERDAQPRTRRTLAEALNCSPSDLIEPLLEAAN